MNHSQIASEILDQSNAQVEHLVWAAVADNNTLVNEILWNLEADEIHKLFPEISEELAQEYIDNQETDQIIRDFGKWGLYARCLYREMKDIEFKEDGTFSSAWMTCVFRERIHYAETLEDLVEQIKQFDEQFHEEQLAKARKEQGIELKA